MLYENTDHSARRWDWVTHPETGRTLELEAGETVDLPEGVEAPFLKPVAKPVKSATEEK